MDLETISSNFDTITIDEKIKILYLLIIKTDADKKIKDLIDDGIEFYHINKYVKFDKGIIDIVVKKYKNYNITKDFNNIINKKIYDIIHDNFYHVELIGGGNNSTPSSTSLTNFICKNNEDKSCKGIIESKNSKRYKELCGGKGKTKINGEWFCGYHNKK